MHPTMKKLRIPQKSEQLKARTLIWDRVIKDVRGGTSRAEGVTLEGASWRLEGRRGRWPWVTGQGSGLHSQGEEAAREVWGRPPGPRGRKWRFYPECQGRWEEPA